MLVEATDKPIRYRLRDGRVFMLRPRQPVDLPDPIAESLLRRAGSHVRRVEPPPATATPTPPVCPSCHGDRFYCPTCEAGHWVCACSHPRLAQHIAQSPPIPARLTPGAVVAWHSPQWGLLRGVYLAPVGRRQVRVHHPLTRREAVIPTAWLTEQEG